ncbi:hypothetical protein U1Q18_014433, partial [Sarracenia purpurea var. burkii]
SSLAAPRVDNFYHPPEWTPKQGSLNKFYGQHALRERARQTDQGILMKLSISFGNSLEPVLQQLEVDDSSWLLALTLL